MTTSSQNQPVRIGIIGFGGIGRWHARLIRGMPTLELTAVADVDRNALDHGAGLTGVDLYTDPGALLDLAAIELVSICSSPRTHVELIEAAAAAGRHVLVEKPLALDLSEVDRAIDACRAADVHLGVVHQQRARSACRAIRRLIEGGELGEPLTVSVNHTWLRTPDSGKQSWRASDRRGGGLLLDQAIHAIDLLIYFLGRPRRVSGMVARRSSHAAGEDCAAAVVEFESGALASLAASSIANAGRDDITIEIAGTRGLVRLEIRDYDHAEISRLELSKDRGKRAVALSSSAIESLMVRARGNWRNGPRSLPWKVAELVADRPRGRRPFRSPRAYLRRLVDRAAQRQHGEPQGHAAVLDQMAAAVRGQGLPLVSGEEARLAHAIIAGILDSAERYGDPVTVDSRPAR